MNNSRKSDRYLVTIIAIAAPFIILAACYGVGKWILPTIVSAFGIGKAAVVTVATASWMPVAGGALAGATTLFVLVHSVTKIAAEVPKNKFLWGATLFAAISPFILDFCKEFYVDTQDRLLKVLFKGIVVVTFVIAAVLWGETGQLKNVSKNELIFRRAMAAVAYLTIPTIILLRSWQSRGLVSPSTWFAVTALLLLFGVLVLLQRIFA